MGRWWHLGPSKIPKEYLELLSINQNARNGRVLGTNLRQMRVLLRQERSIQWHIEMHQVMVVYVKVALATKR